MIQLELASLTHLKVWGDAKMFCSDIAFLLVLPKEGAVGERVYGLAIMWVHPYQARVPQEMMQPSNLPSLPPLGPTGPMPWCGSMGMPATCPSLQRVT